MFLKIFQDLGDLIETMNSCLTMPLASLVLFFFIFNLFLLFNAIWGLMRDGESFLLAFLPDGTLILMNYFIQGVMAHSSYTASRQAKETSVIVSKIISNRDSSESHQEIFKNFLVQNQYRNLDFQNALFVIDWKLLLAVHTYLGLKLSTKTEFSVFSRFSRHQQRIWL